MRRLLAKVTVRSSGIGVEVCISALWPRNRSLIVLGNGLPSTAMPSCCNFCQCAGLRKPSSLY